MQRNEFFLAAVLVLVILAGIGYNYIQGAGKTAEVIVTHPGTTPFDEIPVSASQETVSNSSIPDATFPQQTSSSQMVIFFNQATVDQLENLPGIGPVLAQRILDQRDKRGRFNTLDDILSINGIGEKKMSAIMEALQSMALSKSTNRFRQPAPLVPFQPPRVTPGSMQPTARPTPIQSKGKLSLNKVGIEELVSLPGIGETLAALIVQERNHKKYFRSWKDVGNIPGIGEKRLQLLKQNFTLSLK